MMARAMPMAVAGANTDPMAMPLDLAEMAMMVAMAMVMAIVVAGRADDDIHLGFCTGALRSNAQGHGGSGGYGNQCFSKHVK